MCHSLKGFEINSKGNLFIIGLKATFIFLHESVCLMIILSFLNIIYEKSYMNTKEM